MTDLWTAAAAEIWTLIGRRTTCNTLRQTYSMMLFSLWPQPLHRDTNTTWWWRKNTDTDRWIDSWWKNFIWIWPSSSSSSTLIFKGLCHRHVLLAEQHWWMHCRQKVPFSSSVILKESSVHAVVFFHTYIYTYYIYSIYTVLYISIRKRCLFVWQRDRNMTSAIKLPQGLLSISFCSELHSSHVRHSEQETERHVWSQDVRTGCWWKVFIWIESSTFH